MKDRAGFRVPAHAVTTRNLGAAYPLVAEAGLGHRGVLIGHDLLGGSFVYDPFELYASGVVSNPNMIVFGQIGRGKSSLLKTYLWRQAVFGRRAWVVDPKGEYAALAERWGVRPVALRPGGTVRLNPLDPVAPGRAGAVPDDPDRRQCELLASLASACLNRPLLPRERAAADLALVSIRADGVVPTLPAVVAALLDPAQESASRIRTERTRLLEDGRDVALELRRLVDGDLRGMFDGENSSIRLFGWPGTLLASPFTPGCRGTRTASPSPSSARSLAAASTWRPMVGPTSPIRSCSETTTSLPTRGSAGPVSKHCGGS